MNAPAFPRFIKIDAGGLMRHANTTEWVAVHDTLSCLMWTVEVLPRQTFQSARERVAKLTTAGFTDWRLPTVEELFCLADRTRSDPAIDTGFFPNTPSGWFWSGTVDASSPSDCAWYVNFGNGSSYWYHQNSEGFVRAVRS